MLRPPEPAGPTLVRGAPTVGLRDSAPARVEVSVWRDVVTVEATDGSGSAARAWRAHCHDCAARFVARRGFLLQQLATKPAQPAAAAGGGGGCARRLGAWYSPGCNPVHCEWPSLFAET